MIKISTWNICLGLKNKKDYIYDTLRDNNIDICALQEVEIDKNSTQSLMGDRDYKIEIEKSTGKARSAIAIKNNIQYTRRDDLEKEDSSIVIIDINVKPVIRLLNIYRSFSPPNGKNQKLAFDEQIQILKSSLDDGKNKEVVILGDFNLDSSKKNLTDYRFKNYFDSLDLIIDQFNLSQIIEFPTWQRIINNTLKESTLDHVYLKNPLIVNKISHCKPLIGDHMLVMLNLICEIDEPKIVIRRCWKNYSKDKLLAKLRNVNFIANSQDPQFIWNNFENELVTIIDELIPYVPFINNQSKKSQEAPPLIKRKLNLRKNLLKKLKSNPSNVLRDRVKNLNVEIKQYYSNQKKNCVQRSIIPGNSKTLWKAVKVAKNISTSDYPNEMYLGDELINKIDLPNKFADHFENKVKKIVQDTQINPNVYNGKRKLIAPSEFFMSPDEISLAINSLKIKNCEGFDKIPQRVLIDGFDVIKYPLAVLFKNIYETKEIPSQWLVSKVIPIHKKGNVSNIENYRPISNLCSTSKIFEKLILLKLNSLELKHKIDITGKSQHGFKSKHSTATASLTLQSLIASALDGDNFAIMASLDLSSAFDVVNVELLLKRLRIIGIPNDLVDLISKWLKDRFFYVDVDGNSSFIHCSDVGTVQGSILGPILYAIFVSPLFDLAKMTLFADDNYILEWNKCLARLIIDMQKKIESITKWLRQSGLKVNDAKTELCLFHRKDHHPIELIINGRPVVSKTKMNVLGITFDSKLQWQFQVQNTVNKCRQALTAIYMIRKYFTKEQLLQIITSNYYSILYYNAEIWLLPTLKPQLKQKIIAASAAPLKIITKDYNHHMSYSTIHYLNKRALPSQITNYKHALILYKIYNSNTMDNDFMTFFFNQQFTARRKTIKFTNTSKFKIGNNLIANRLTVLNGKIELNWLNLPLNSYKIVCKKEFLSV